MLDGLAEAVARLGALSLISESATPSPGTVRRPLEGRAALGRALAAIAAHSAEASAFWAIAASLARGA